jgi:Zn-dependent M28 family amino/carboxypeptidase
LVFIILGIVLAVIIVPMAGMLFFFKTKWCVLGANDNLSAIAITQGIAETLGTNKELIPKHTKILLVSFGSEEAGLRGSKRWVKRHKEELQERPFYYLNFDGVAKSQDLHVIDKEVTLGVKYNPDVVQLVGNAAEKAVITLTNRALPFGATDGSAIFLGGFPNGASMAAMDIDNDKTWYHTINDTADEVEPEALENARKIAIEFMKIIDSLN